MNKHEKINYVEYPATDLEKTKKFFQVTFGWKFQDFGPEYAAFTNQGIDGGFFKADMSSTTETGGALIVFFSDELENTLAKVENAGGIIVKDIFPFPGGRRFHFKEPSGNEFAVWSDK